MPPKSKKRKLNESKTEEVVFDPSARFDYLTGFHKRKVERAKHAQEAALRRAREEKILHRKQIRQERKEEVERHVREVNAMLPPKLFANRNEDDGGDSDEDSWNGLPDPEPLPVDHEDEYIDEDRYTTVTVEEIDISRDGLTKLQERDKEQEIVQPNLVREEETTKLLTKPKTRKPGAAGDKERSAKSKKRKKRDFRYESKADRKQSHLKVRAKKSKLAQARREK